MAKNAIQICNVVFFLTIKKILNMANKKEKSANFHKGVRDAKKGKSAPPSGGVNWKASAIVGGVIGGLPGLVIGALLGDSDKTSRDKRQNKGAYNAGNKRK
jgi:hypothetical protein